MVVAEVVSNRLLESSMKGDLKSIQYVTHSRRRRPRLKRLIRSRPAISIFRTKAAFASSFGGYAIWSTRMNEMAALPGASSPGLSERDLVPSYSAILISPISFPG
jgi:hypothetical protein